MRYGYARVSTQEQNLERQLSALNAANVDRIFTDKESGAKASRKGLNELLSLLREGDVVIVHSFDRLARSTRQLLDLSEKFKALGVDFISLKEQVDTSTPQGKLYFTISSAFAEFEREMIRQRQAEGIANYKAKHNGKGAGRPRISDEKKEAVVKLYEGGMTSQDDIASTLGLSRSSVHNILKARGLR